MSVHNHRPYRPVCNERRTPDGVLRGACLNDDGTPVSVRGRTGDDTEALAAQIASAMSNPHLKPEIAIHAWGDHGRRVADWLLGSDWLAARDARVAADAVAGVLALADEWEGLGVTVHARSAFLMAAAALRAVVAPHTDTEPPCGASCPGDCGWNPNAADDPCAPPTDTEEKP